MKAIWNDFKKNTSMDVSMDQVFVNLHLHKQFLTKKNQVVFIVNEYFIKNIAFYFKIYRW